MVAAGASASIRAVFTSYRMYPVLQDWQLDVVVSQVMHPVSQGHVLVRPDATFVMPVGQLKQKSSEFLQVLQLGEQVPDGMQFMGDAVISLM